jgi:signal peptidase II
VLLAGLVIAVDQYTKHLAVKSLMGRPAVDVINGFFQFRYVENPGAAWGFLASAPESFRSPFFICVSLLAISFIMYFFHRLAPSARAMIVSLSLILGGAMGNFIDRLRYKYVVDFIHWYYKDNYWPTFNVADVGISVGVGLMVLVMIFGDEKDGAAGTVQKADPPVS